MNPMQHLENWLENQLSLIESCTDSQESFRLRHDYRTVYSNMEVYEKLLKGGHYYHVCQECGIVELTRHYSNNDTLIEHPLCFPCNHWREVSERHVKHPDEKLIVNGKLYSDAGNKPNCRSGFLGHAGHVFTILTDDGRQWQTNDLWCGGDIPLKYRLTTMKDNAKFL